MTFSWPQFPITPNAVGSILTVPPRKTDPQLLEEMQTKLEQAISFQEVRAVLESLRKEISYRDFLYSWITFCFNFNEYADCFEDEWVGKVRSTYPLLCENILFRIVQLQYDSGKIFPSDFPKVRKLLRNDVRFDSLLVAYGKKNDFRKFLEIINSEFFFTKESKKELMKFFAAKEPFWFTQNLEICKRLSDEQDVYEVGLTLLENLVSNPICSEYGIYNFLTKVNCFPLHNTDLLKKMALWIAEHGNKNAISNLLQKLSAFGVIGIAASQEEEHFRKQLLILCARKDMDSAICVFKQDFLQDGGATLYHIVRENKRACTYQVWKFLADNVENLGLSDPLFLQKLALLMAKNTNRDVAYLCLGNIEKFMGPFPAMESVRVEIAKILLQEFPGELIRRIPHFYITQDQRALYEIARAAITTWNGFCYVIDNINHLGLVEEGLRIDLARHAASLNGEYLAKSMHKWQITNTDTLFELAKICVSHNGRILALVQNKELFHLLSEEKWIALAHLAAVVNGEYILENFDTLPITNSRERLNLIKKAFFNVQGFLPATLSVIRDMKKYRLTESQRVDLALFLVVQENGHLVMYHLTEFAIDSPYSRMLICLTHLKSALASGRPYESAVKSVEPHLDTLTLRKSLLKYHFSSVWDWMEKKKKELSLCNNSLIQSRLKSWLECLELDCIYNAITLESGQPIMPALLCPVSPREEESKTMGKTGGASSQGTVRKKEPFLPYRRKPTYHGLTEILSNPTGRGTQERFLVFSTEVLDALWDFHNPMERFHLLSLLCDISRNERLSSIFQELKKNIPNKSLLIPHLVLTLLIGQASSPERELGRYVNLFQKFPPHWHDAVVELPIFLQTIEALAKDEELSSEEKYLVVEKLLHPLMEKSTAMTSSQKFTIMTEHARYIISLVKNGFSRELRQVITGEKNFQDVLFTVFQKAFNLGGIEHFEEKYKASFGTFRNQTAIFLYRASLKKTGNVQAVDIFNKSVCNLLEGQFLRMRYDVNQSPHLKALFDTHPKIWQLWQEKSPSILFNSVVQAEGPRLQEFDYVEFLLNSFGYQHLDSKQYPFLYSFLQGTMLKEAALQAIETEKKKNLPESERNALELQEICFELCREVDPRRSLELLQRLPLLLPTGCEFRNDIQVPIKFLTEPKKDFSSYSLTISDSYEDLLLCGTEVFGSCQRVNGDPQYNRCLLAYIVDGKNQLITLNNPNGEIEARAILRLLFDQNKQPALYMERIYGSEDPQVKNALKTMAKIKAKEIGVRLYSNTGRGSKMNLESLGSPAPYEYVDATHLGVVDGGIFSFEAREDVLT